jgi:hypothetical protein
MFRVYREGAAGVRVDRRRYPADHSLMEMGPASSIPRFNLRQKSDWSRATERRSVSAKLWRFMSRDAWGTRLQKWSLLRISTERHDECRI